METMKKLCRYFERLHPGYTARLNEIDSYRGWYGVYVTSPEGYTSEYWATGTREFREWAKGVVL